MLDVVQIEGLDLWVFALGQNSEKYLYDVRVLDKNEVGEIVGIARLFDLPVESNLELSARDASEQLVTIAEKIEAYRRYLEQDQGAPASGPGSISA